METWGKPISHDMYYGGQIVEAPTDGSANSRSNLMSIIYQDHGCDKWAKCTNGCPLKIRDCPTFQGSHDIKGKVQDSDQVEKEKLMKSEKIEPGVDPEDLENLDLPSRTYNALRRGGIDKISQVITMSDEQLHLLYRMGPAKIQDIRIAVKVYQRKVPAGRSLYQCFHARVKGGVIRCAKGALLSSIGIINISELKAGKPLVMKVCQACPQYEEMGTPEGKLDRGWR